MLCQAKAFLPVSMNHVGTASRAFSAWLKAPSSWSSSQSLRTWLASPYVDLVLALSEGGESARPAHPLQAASPLRPDAADRDTELAMDIRIGMRWVGQQHRQQLLAARRQLGEGRAQRRVPLSHQELLADHRVVYEKHRVVQACPQPLGFTRRGHDAQAFTRGGRRQPARQCSGLAELA